MRMQITFLLIVFINVHSSVNSLDWYACTNCDYPFEATAETVKITTCAIGEKCVVIHKFCLIISLFKRVFLYSYSKLFKRSS